MVMTFASIRIVHIRMYSQMLSQTSVLLKNLVPIAKATCPLLMATLFVNVRSDPGSDIKDYARGRMHKLAIPTERHLAVHSTCVHFNSDSEKVRL